MKYNNKLSIRYDGYDVSRVTAKATDCQPIHGSLLDREPPHVSYFLQSRVTSNDGDRELLSSHK